MDLLTSETPPKADVAPDRPAEVPATSPVPTVVAIVIFAVVAGLGAWFIHRFAVNMIYFDQWTDIGLIQRAHSGTLTLSALWAQHNENRVFFPNLIVLALAYTTHFDIVVEDYICGALIAGAAALLIVAHKRRSPSLSWLAYTPVALVLVGYVTLSDALFGYQIGWFLVLVGLAGSLFCLDRPDLSRLAMVGAIAFGVVGSFSAIEGLFIWPAGLVLLFLRCRSVRTMAVWTVSGVVAGILYFLNYNFNAAGGNDSYMLHHPFDAVKFFFGTLGNVVDTFYPSSSPTVGNDLVTALGVLVFAVAVWALFVGFRRGQPGGSAVGVALICFGFLFDAFTTLGRVQLGLSTGDRYSLFALMVWVGAYLVLVRPIPRGEQARAQWVARFDAWARVPREGASEGGASVAVPPLPRLEVANWAVLLGMVTLMAIQVLVGFGSALADGNGWKGQELAVADVTANIDQASDGLVSQVLGNYPASFIRPLAAFAQADQLSQFHSALGAELARQGLSSAFLVHVVDPTAWATVSGVHGVDAVNNAPGVTGMEFRLTGGRLHDALIGKGTPTYDGWVLLWNTTTTPNGIYGLQGVALKPGHPDIDSAVVHIIVHN